MSGAALHPLDLGVVVLYLAGMVAVGALVSQRIAGFRDFFVAGGVMTTPLLVCTLVSTYYGLDVLFGGSELSYQEGVVAWFAYTRPYYVAILAAAFLVAPRLRRYPFLSLPDALGHFYGNGTRAIAAVASFFYALPFMAVMGIGVLLDVVLGIPFAWGVLIGAAVSAAYTVMGGLMADALTDTIQFVLMCVALGVAAVLTLQRVGGVEGLQARLPAPYFEPMGTYPVLLILVFSASALSVLVEPAFYQRIFAADSQRSIVAALLIGIVLWAAFDWIVTIMGMVAAATGVETEPRYALLTVTLQALPVGLKGIFIAGVMATAMSTIDSYLLIAGGNLSYDLYRPLLRPDLGDAALLRLTRWTSGLAALVCVALALFFESMVAAWIFMSTLLTSAVFVPLLAALFAPWRARARAGLWSSVAGMATALAFYWVVGARGALDPEWGTTIWTVRVGPYSLDLWREYALLAALPASTLAYTLGHLASPEPCAAPDALPSPHPDSA